MKRLIFTVMVSSLILLTACAPAVTDEEEVVIPEVASPKKISLEDAPDILNLSLLLPSRFEHLDAASEGFSKEDMGLGSDESVSEIQLYMSEDPFQIIYGIMAIYETGRIQGAAFKSAIEDESQMKDLISKNIIAGADEVDIEVTVPNIEITHPNIGDAAVLGEGYMESYGFYFGFDTCWFRRNDVYIYWYSLYMSENKVSLVTISQELEKRINRFSQ